VEQLDEIPGVGITSAQELTAETGTSMTRFPTAGHLVSWAKFAPIGRNSAGKRYHPHRPPPRQETRDRRRRQLHPTIAWHLLSDPDAQYRR
jgi:transposase